MAIASVNPTSDQVDRIASERMELAEVLEGMAMVTSSGTIDIEMLSDEGDRGLLVSGASLDWKPLTRP